jgi:hypothetical protein
MDQSGGGGNGGSGVVILRIANCKIIQAQQLEVQP